MYGPATQPNLTKPELSRIHVVMAQPVPGPYIFVVADTQELQITGDPCFPLHGACLIVFRYTINATKIGSTKSLIRQAGRSSSEAVGETRVQPVGVVNDDSRGGANSCGGVSVRKQITCNTCSMRALDIVFE